LTIQRFGFTPQTVRASVAAGTTTKVTVDLRAETVHEEEVIVTATRTGKRIEDEPLRVEVLDHEEIEEKTLMTPGDIAMLLNETSGLRVQVTAPSLGAANVRIQGLRGRYTQILADGLPLYGGQTGAIGLLQIPPMDLGQVEVIKGVASALYGASALGGVINLVSRRPEEHERELLVNRTTRNGTDAVLWLAAPTQTRWAYTLLGGGHFQERTDLDSDGWVDLAGYQRAVIRPRLFWDNGAGRTLFATVGVMAEDRKGGTIGAATVPDGSRFPEELTTRRLDTGLVGRFLAGTRLVSVRGSAMTQRHRHQFGDVVERDRHDTWFGETALSGTNGTHTWVIGAAIQGDLYRSHDVSRFDYTYTVPGVFAQDEYAPAPWVTLSASGRLDAHNEFGAFFNPRASALLRLPRRWVLRASTGTGFFAPTPFTEETEAVGLTRVLPLRDLEAERAWSASVDLGWSARHLEVNGTLFSSIIRNAVMLRESAAPGGLLEIVNALGPTRTLGSELLARLHAGQFALVLTHTFVQSTEVDAETGARGDVPLTPRHTGGLVGMWEDEARGRVGIEVFYTGRQRLEDNPYRDRSTPYVFFGVLAERRFGRLRLFVNAENISNVRQTRDDSLVRPERHVDGRWTVDAWAPLEGRIVNGGIRIHF
jgi:outer membrane receptor for ferrienterochelin and colicins